MKAPVDEAAATGFEAGEFGTGFDESSKVKAGGPLFRKWHSALIELKSLTGIPGIHYLKLTT